MISRVLDWIAERLMQTSVRRRLSYGCEETVRRDAAGRIQERVRTYPPSREERGATRFAEEFAPAGYLARSTMYRRDGSRSESKYGPDGSETQSATFDANGKVESSFTFTYDGDDVTVTSTGRTAASRTGRATRGGCCRGGPVRSMSGG